MRWGKRWLSVVMITVMLFALIPAAYAEETAPRISMEGQASADQGGEDSWNSGQITLPEAQAEQEGGEDQAPLDSDAGADLDSAQTAPSEAQIPQIEPESQGVTSAVYGEPRNLASSLSYEWSEAPEAAYADESNKLTDGQYGGLDISDPAWVGHLKKKTREVVFDLGEPKSITNIKANFLQDWPTNNVLMPLTVSMYVSEDKQDWGLLSHYATQTLWRDGQYKETYEWDGSKDGIKALGPDAKIAYARYVKVTFSMHTKAMSFVDEIEIWGTDGKAEDAKIVPTQQPAFLAPGEATAGIKHLGLLYNGHYSNDLGTWMKERIIPNISYVDKTGEPVDWLFDGILYLGTFSPQGRSFGAGSDVPSILEDWEWYLDKTFASEGDMVQLNEATREVGAKLGQPDYKEKVVLMIPYPDEGVANFGTVNGENLSFKASVVGKEKALANRVKAIQWYLNEVQQRWTAADYSQLELVGMYWLEEQIGTSGDGPELLRLVSERVHAMTASSGGDMKFFWIPHFLAYKSFMWQDVGIDAVAFQPNYFFEPMDYDRLEDAANIAKRYGMSNEFEFDDRMLTDGVFRERYIDYLNSGVETGLMTEGFNAYYQGNNAVYNSAMSTDPSNRVLYDWLHQYVQGTYQINQAEPPQVDVFMNGEPFQSGIILPDTESVQFTWQVREDDGLTKVTALFDGKPYTAGTVVPLAGKLGKHELLITVTSGKSVKTSYVVEASTDAAGIRALVDRFQQEQQITSAAAVRSLHNYLEMMQRYEGKDAAQTAKYLKGLNAKLDQFMKADTLKAEAYPILKESIYYLVDNLSQNKAVEASSTEGGNLNYVPSKAVDGFLATRWASDYVDNTWFQVDLGEAKQIDTVRIDWEYARAKTYKLLVSDDKKTWTNVMEDDGVITAHDGKETVQFSPVTARYIRFQGVQRNTDYGYSFYEFGVYRLTGDVEVQAVDGLQAAVDAATKKVTIDGLMMNGDDQASVKLQVLNPQGKVHYEAQTDKTTDGKLQFTFTLKGDLEGTYEAYASTPDMAAPAKVSFVYKKAGSGNGDGGSNGNGGDNSSSGSGGSSGGSSVPTSPPAPNSVEIKPQADGSVKADASTKPNSGGKMAVAQFTDLGKHVWAQEAIEQLAALGIVKGTSAATFSPAEQVNRAEFIVMLVRALDLEADGSSTFSDVPAEAYYSEAVSIAKQLGIVTGIDGSRFAPAAKITRQDMMVMTARAIQAAKGQAILGDSASLQGFKDTAAISDYAVESIAGMVEQGLIQGDREMLKPRDQATRAEAAVFMYRLLSSLGTDQ